MPVSPASSHGGAGAVAPLTLTGTSDTVQLIVKAAAGQSADIQDWTDSGGSTKAVVGSDGSINTSGTLSCGAPANATQLYVNGDQNTLNDVIQGKGTVGRAGVQLEGGLFTNLNAAPADASLFENGRMVLWLDATAGAAKLMVKAKDAGGTVRTASVPLT